VALASFGRCEPELLRALSEKLRPLGFARSERVYFEERINIVTKARNPSSYRPPTIPPPTIPPPTGRVYFEERINIVTKARNPSSYRPPTSLLLQSLLLPSAWG